MDKKLVGIFTLAACFIAAPAFGATQLETLGGSIYKDVNLSFNQNQACMTCHHPSSGFADPENRILPMTNPVSNGSILTLFGGRNAPSASYAGFSPIFHYDSDAELFVGGLFWDGRATGMAGGPTATGELGSGPTGDPLADQAKGPFGNPVEMGLTVANTGLSTEELVVGVIQASAYAGKFEKLFGPNAFSNIGVAYNNASLAIAAFERSNKITQFRSKFDKFVQEQGGDVSSFGVEVDNGFRRYVGPPAGFKSKHLSYDEADGLAIFNADSYTQNGFLTLGVNGGQCYLCHLTTNHEVVDDAYRPANGPTPGIYNPLFTDFTFDNLGIPVNPQIAILQGGPQPIDLGLGGQTAQLDAAFGESYPSVADEAGKFKVSTLRNLSRTAPYGHNGYFPTIYDVVHFYNTRDILAWESAEVPGTVNHDELGNLGLTLEQEMKLVMFIETLND